MFVCLLHNTDYVITACMGGFFSIAEPSFGKLYYQPHILHTAAVLRAGGDDIDSRCVDTAVTENVRKLGNILFNPIEDPCKQMSQIMGEYLFGINICFCTQ